MSPAIDLTLCVLGIAVLGAIVTGALGYGFSSISVPLALLFLTNRVLNPALVLVEVVLNTVVLWTNRSALPHVWRRILPVTVGLTPGIVAGTYVLSRVDPAWLKAGTFALLLPLILLQAAGYRRPVRAERSAGVILGGGIGLLYSTTTISGPPLALMLSNQGLAGREFRGSLAVIRLTESTLTAVAYVWAGIFSAASMALLPPMLLGVFIGVPIGGLAVRRVPPETFRRVCMMFDALVVAFVLSRVLIELALASTAAAYGLLVVVAAIDGALLVAYSRAASRLSPAVPSDPRRTSHEEMYT